MTAESFADPHISLLVARRRSPRLMDEPHRHTDVELNYVLEGAIAYVIGGRRDRVERGRAAVFWAGMPHRLVEVEGEAEFVYVTVPLAWFLQLGVDSAFVTRLLEGELIQAAVDDELAGATDRIFFERWVDELASGDPEARRTVLLELEARLRRFAAGVVPFRPGRAPEPRPRRAQGRWSGSHASSARATAAR